MTFERCQFCGGAAAHLCDYPLGFQFKEAPDGKRVLDTSRSHYTCDAPICQACRTKVGTMFMCGPDGGVDSIDRCPFHREARDRLALVTAAEALQLRLVAWNGSPKAPPPGPDPDDRPKRQPRLASAGK